VQDCIHDQAGTSAPTVTLYILKRSAISFVQAATRRFP
jgi:hypothetical protein